MMIRALSSIRAQCPDVLYAVAGDGADREYLSRLAEEHRVTDIVQFQGALGDDELVTCYQQCDVFALPNRQIGWDVEGFGMVLLEAQACGRPVIAGMSGGTTDAVQSGRTGELIECDAPDRLAEATVRLLTEPALAARMGEEGRQWVVNNFDWLQRSRQSVEVFHLSSARAL
jgi:phosphatidylinositol alpha-1,6-mannosyltransferase